MRRSHSGIGWRNDNPRHFRPRGGGAPHFRPGRGYGHGDGPRFQAPGPRSLLGAYHNAQPNDYMQGNHNRGYRGNRHNSHPRYPDRSQQYSLDNRQIFPLLQRMMHPTPTTEFYEDNFFDSPNQCHVNNMGDIDDRQSDGGPPNRESFKQRPSPWVNPPFNFEQRSPSKQFRHQDEHNKLPQVDYQGHRPPASDHYGGNQGSTMENSKTFSRSVDDTVNIVRERLLSRESHPSSDTPSSNHTSSDGSQLPIHATHQHPSQEQPAKKKSHKIRNIKTNCDKIKNKIVHQLFKMDKDKIHKLMDNPNSSSKFEYAISSLITESQNSYNRHLRSVAEKSLGTGTEFLHNDNNTIYEDTFMKQMQGLLDPQDTVLLEDIKPMVLAELCKVLQLDDIEQRVEYEEPAYSNEQSQSNQYTGEFYDDDFGPLDDSCYEPKLYTEDKPQIPRFERSEKPFRKEDNTDFGRPLTPFRNEGNTDFDKPITPFSNEANTDFGRPLTPFRNEGNTDFGRPLTPFRNEGNTDYSSSPTPFRTEGNTDLGEPQRPFRNEGNNDFGRSPTPFRNEGSTDFGKPQAPFSNEDYCRPRSPFRNEDFDAGQQCKTLFERRRATVSVENSQSIRSYSEKVGMERKSIDHRPNDNRRRNSTPAPLFDPNADLLSDEDDPFAELDKQYHVAVDHNFIDDISFSPCLSTSQSEQTPPSKGTPKAETIKKTVLVIKPESTLFKKTSENLPRKIKREIDNQLEVMAKSPLKFVSPPYKNEPETPTKSKQTETKQDLLHEIPSPQKPKENIASKTPESVKQEHVPTSNVAEVTPEKHNSSNNMTKAITPSDSRKRSVDQRPSHRKEKRKKSESSLSDSTTNKQILNKNIIINLNDCAKDCASENRDAPKSIFNLFFSKEKGKESSKDSKKVEPNDKGYSDKYVRRKETSSSKKSKDKDYESKKKSDSNSSSHSMLSSTDTSNVSDRTPTKEAQVKLKPIDMFVEQPKKASAPHQAPRNTAPVAAASHKLQMKPIIISRKLTKRHVATQVMRKNLSKEVQTEESKSTSTRFCQTDRKRHITRGSQTDSVHFTSDIKTDPFERMKQIDLEIQALLQEKFKLYNSLENPDCSSTMQSLGMAVLNPVDANQLEESISEDTIVDDFTSIPMEELEDIAFESVQVDQSQDVAEKRSRRQKTIERERNTSQSPATVTASVRKRRSSKAPNISLIEQIITDDRPLEDIISLDDLEVTPRKKKSQKMQSKPKKKLVKNQKEKASKPIDYKLMYDIKDCTIALIRQDLQKLLKNLQKAAKSNRKKELEMPKKPEMSGEPVEVKPPEPPAETYEEATEPVIEEVVNDIPIDMLDVSEDIVIGDEVKSGEKELDSSNPDIILDNSQSSVEEASGAGGGSEGECRMFDFSSDENLRRDSVTVSGNGDAVLAVECIENNFIAACLDGNVYYFSGDGKLLNTLRGSNLAVTCLTIVKEKHGTTIYTGSLDSRIRYYDLESGLEKGPECNVLSPIQTMDRAWGTIFVGTRTGFVLQFECKNNMLIPVSTVKFSEQSILALRAMKEGPRKVLLVAARSEPVTIKDAQTGLLLRTLEGPKMTVYTLLFEDGKVYCGTSSHEIHVFDYVSGSHVFSHSGGKGAVCLRASGGLIFAGCYDGCVYVYRDGQAKPLAQLKGPGLMLLSLAVHASKIIAGYKDRSLYIWKIPHIILQEMVL